MLREMSCGAKRSRAARELDEKGMSLQLQAT